MGKQKILLTASSKKVAQSIQCTHKVPNDIELEERDKKTTLSLYLVPNQATKFTIDIHVSSMNLLA